MVTIVTDTTACLPKSKYSELGIPLLPQIIVFGEKEYRDDTELDTAGFLEKLRASSNLPKTSAPPPALYQPIYEKYSANGGTIIVLIPSSDLSGTFRAASVATEEFPNADIRLIDTRSVAGGLGSIVLQAAKWVAQGLSADEVEQNIRNMSKREHVYFLIDTLEYLHKGGRIGGAKALFGSILQVKPILTLKNGKVEAADSQRTKKKALARLIEMVVEDCPRDASAYLSVSHCDALEEAESLKVQLETILGISDVPIYELPPAIVVHAGPKTMSVSYFIKE
jgi:DegV family protein with EDD domain